MEFIRDLVIIIYGILGILAFLLIIFLTLLLFLKVGPILDSARRTLGSIQGTTSLMSDTVIKPIVKGAGFAVGVRQALAIILGLSRRKGGKKGG